MEKIQISNNYIFLDIDGVLNSRSFGIEEDKLKLLNELVVKTNSNVVISSSWRLESSLYNILKDKIENVVGKTTNLLSRYTTIEKYDKIRLKEIKKYIGNNNIVNYVIIDDLEFNNLNIKNFYKTEMHIGLTEEICIEIERYFSGTKK